MRPVTAYRQVKQVWYQRVGPDTSQAATLHVAELDSIWLSLQLRADSNLLLGTYTIPIAEIAWIEELS